MKINKESVTIGGDPEVFLINRDGHFVSAIGKIPGSKEEPYLLPELGKEFAIQTDCCSVEFNLPVVQFTPYFIEASADEFYENVRTMFTYIENIIPNGLSISLATSAEFSKEDLKHPQARLAGCSVDYNAWEEIQNQTPDFSSTNIRCNGAHLHFGYEGFNDKTSIELIKALDLTLGVTSILFDGDTERRKLYGKAGCFRMTKFGVEYRTPSPFYLKSKELVRYVFKAIDLAIDLVNNNTEYSDEDVMFIQYCINTGNPHAAKEIITKYNLQTKLSVHI